MSERYGFLNGVPIEAGDGWELIPLDEQFGEVIEFIDGRGMWINFMPEPTCCITPAECFSKHGRGEILAFRRPKSVAPRVPDSDLPTVEDVQNIYTISRQAAQLTTIRTTLDTAEGALQDLVNGVNEATDQQWRGPFPIPNCIDRMVKALNALTLIAQTREVGE